MPTCLFCSDIFDSGRQLRRSESHNQSAVEDRKKQFQTMCQLLEIPDEQWEIVVNQTCDFITDYEFYCRTCMNLVTEMTTLVSQIEGTKTSIKSLKNRIYKKKKDLSEMIDKVNENVAKVRCLVVESENRRHEEVPQNNFTTQSCQKSFKRKCKGEDDPDAKREKIRRIIWDCMPLEARGIEVNEDDVRNTHDNIDEEQSISEEIKIEPVSEENSDFSSDYYSHLHDLPSSDSLNDRIIEFKEEFTSDGLESPDEMEDAYDMNLQNAVSSPVEINKFETPCGSNLDENELIFESRNETESETVDIIKPGVKGKAKTSGNAKTTRFKRKVGSEESDGSDSDWFEQEGKHVLLRKEDKIRRQNERRKIKRTEMRMRKQETNECKSWISLEYEKYMEKYELSVDGTINYRGIQILMRGDIYECGRCGMTFKNRVVSTEPIVNFRRTSRCIIQHITEKYLDGYKCDLCTDKTKTHTSLMGLLNHRRTHANNKIDCEICGKPLRNEKKNLSRHLWFHKNKEEQAAAIQAGKKRPSKSPKNNAHLCSQCGKSFTSAKNLGFHEETHLNPTERNKLKVLCPVCGKNYPKAQLNAHIKTVHERSKCHSYSCKFCDSRFISTTLLNIHVRKIHTKERPFSCGECDKSFYTKTLLKYHTRSHSDEKQFSCTVCSSRYKYKTGLNRHNLMAHSVRNASTVEMLAPPINKDFGEIQ